MFFFIYSKIHGVFRSYVCFLIGRVIVIIPHSLIFNPNIGKKRRGSTQKSTKFCLVSEVSFWESRYTIFTCISKIVSELYKCTWDRSLFTYYEKKVKTFYQYQPNEQPPHTEHKKGTMTYMYDVGNLDPDFETGTKCCIQLYMGYKCFTLNRK